MIKQCKLLLLKQRGLQSPHFGMHGTCLLLAEEIMQITHYTDHESQMNERGIVSQHVRTTVIVVLKKSVYCVTKSHGVHDCHCQQSPKFTFQIMFCYVFCFCQCGQLSS